MKPVIRWLIHPPVTGPASIFIIRLLPGAVFGCEGIATLVMMNSGTNKIPMYVFAIGELLGSLFLAGGLFTRITAFFLVIHSLVAVFFANIDGAGIRCDYAQIMTCLFLMLEGAGRWSADFYIATHRQPIFKINQNK